MITLLSIIVIGHILITKTICMEHVKRPNAILVVGGAAKRRLLHIEAIFTPKVATSNRVLL
jgi:hypothetical protein